MVAQRPNYIPLPPPHFSLNTDDDSDLSPQFHTAPSTPDLPSPQFFYTPPTSPLSEYVPTSDDDPPPSVDLAIDLALTDDNLNTLEKIYIFSRSKTIFHRVFIVHALPSFLHEVSPQEANEYVLPLLTGLALDDEEQVKEALAAELVPIIWWFFTHCKVISDDPGRDVQNMPTLPEVAISVQAFTPILGTLLLSPNPHVGGVARYAVVDLLERMRKADDRVPSDHGASSSVRHTDGDVDFVTGLFGLQERAMFQEEILQQVVIGMCHLDVDSEHLDMGLPGGEQGLPTASDDNFAASQPSQPEALEHRSVKDTINPYFSHNLLPSLDHSSVSLKNLSSTSGSSAELFKTSDTISVAEHKPRSQKVSFVHTDTLSFEQTCSADQSAPPVIGLVCAQPADEITPLPSRSVLPVIQLNPLKQGRLSPDLIDALPSSSRGEKNACNQDDMEYNAAHDRRFGHSWNCACDDFYDPDDYENQKAAVGRLSSMSLMAAVTASGILGEDAKQAFVKELEHVSRDPIPWVRTEASFALGALAKVVPEEVVQYSLLPLFNRLRWDSTWRVRHSAVFALPAILARLHPFERRKLATDTIIGLVTDESTAVRLGVLEVLGEVLSTFRGDEDGVPQDLLDLFLGRKIGLNSPHFSPNQDILDLFLQEPKRHLIRAFNYPAVVLALGKERWKDVRDLYLSLAADSDFKVQRTLTASLGELARIIGEDNAQQDLMRVWWNALKSDAEEIRLKALEAVETFSAALGRRAGCLIIQEILTTWDEGAFKTWRERDCVAKLLRNVSREGHQDISLVIYGLLQRVLEDNVAAVRESAAAALPHIRRIFANQPDFLSRLHDYLLSLAHAATYRKRMTFIACQHAIVSSHDEQPMSIPDNDTLNAIAKLANDNVDGVRIGTARLVGAICKRYSQNAMPITGTLLKVTIQLFRDDCHDVRAYVPDLIECGRNNECTASSKAHIPGVYIFSRPPDSSRAREG